jgi:RNA polymerase sigma-70 factor (ECF subfamily)
MDSGGVICRGFVVPLTDLDRKLLSDLLSGQSGSWRLFVDRFDSLILHVIRHTAQAHSLKLNDDDIEDLCADTFAELLLRDMAALRAFRGRCSLATYLGVIARRIVVRKLTEHRFNKALGHVSAHQAAVDFASSEAPVGRQVEQKEQVEHLFRQLPDEHRQLLTWAITEGLSYREIARRLRRPVNSIGPLIQRAKAFAAGLWPSAGQPSGS